MVLHPEKIREAVFSVIPAERIAGIYQVGMIDDSPLSDTDVIVVFFGEPTIFERTALSNLSKKSIDVHGVFSSEIFVKELPFLNAAELRPVFGEVPVAWAPVRQDQKRSLVKLGLLFFTSFLRNFYELQKKISTAEQVLKHLNDFEYVEAYAPHLVATSLHDLLHRIRVARRAPERLAKADIENLLSQGIDEAWRVVELLNEHFKTTFEQLYPPTIFLGREPTIFAPFSSSDCRRQTERFLWWGGRTRVLVLPLGFQFIFTPDSVISGFTERYLKNRTEGAVAWIKQRAKRSFAQLLHVVVYAHAIYRSFSPDEAYSVKRAVTTYRDTGRLSEAEAACLDAARLTSESSILDVGCGAGRTTLALLERGFLKTIGIDFAPGLITAAKEAHGGKYADHFYTVNILEAERNFVPASFDAVLFSFNGLDYLFPYEKRLEALSVMGRLLKPGGYLIFSTHRPVVANREAVRSLKALCLALLHRTPYGVVRQSFGKLLTYRGGDRRVNGELKKCGFEVVKKIYNISTLPRWRDPFPYRVVRKII